MKKPTTAPAINLLALIAAVNLATAKRADRGIDPVNENEVVIGVLPDDLIRLHYLRDQKSEELKTRKAGLDADIEKHLQSHADPGHTREDCRLFHEKLEEVTQSLTALLEQCSAIDDIFWKMVRLAFPEIAAANNIGIRQGNQVVRYEGSDNIEDELMRAIFGGGIEGLDLADLLGGRPRDFSLAGLRD